MLNYRKKYVYLNVLYLSIIELEIGFYIFFVMNNRIDLEVNFKIK